MSKCFVVGLSLAFINTFAFSEERASSIPPPKAPFIQAAPYGSRWFMEISRSDSSPNEPQGGEVQSEKSAIPARLEMEIGQNRIRHGIITLANGQKEEFYQLNSINIEKCANSKRIARSPVRFDPSDQLSLRSSSFPGISWLSEKNYVGTEALGLKNCYKFHVAQGGKNLPYSLEKDVSVDEMTAWIDLQTRYPVRVQIGPVTYDFSEVTAYRQDIQPKSEFAAALKKVSSPK